MLLVHAGAVSLPDDKQQKHTEKDEEMDDCAITGLKTSESSVSCEKLKKTQSLSALDILTHYRLKRRMELGCRQDGWESSSCASARPQHGRGGGGGVVRVDRFKGWKLGNETDTRRQG